MFLFGHLGITLGAAQLITSLVTVSQNSLRNRKSVHSQQLKSDQYQPEINNTPPSMAETLGKFFDIRLLLLGSILPDIIDKPIGIILLNSGRIFTHSLTLSIILSGIGFLLYFIGKQVGILALASGIFTHIILDKMWEYPQIFLWPFFGWGFAEGVRENFIHVWLSMLFSQPEVYLPELAGIVILLIFAWRLVRNDNVLAFLKRGQS